MSRKNSFTTWVMNIARIGQFANILAFPTEELLVSTSHGSVVTFRIKGNFWWMNQFGENIFKILNNRKLLFQYFQTSLIYATRHAYIYNTVVGICTAIIIYSAINPSLSVTHTPMHTYFHCYIATLQRFIHELNQKCQSIVIEAIHEKPSYHPWLCP